MVRQSLFNILGQDMTGRKVLDLYAGTGGVGLEAVSRGASSCVLVDKGAEAAGLCRRNAERLAFTDRVEVLVMDVTEAVERLASRGLRFDLVFAGPPFSEKTETIGALCAAIARPGLLAPGGVFVLQLPSRGFEPPAAEDLLLVKDRSYGTNRLLFYEEA